MELFGNTLLITGGASGIGLALAHAFAQRNNKVIVCGRDATKLAAAQRAVPGLEAKRCDLTVAAERDELVTWTLQRFPELNMLINNAGVVHSLDLRSDTFDFDLIRQEFAINLQVPIEITLHLLPYLKRRERAALVNVTTGQVYSPNAATPVYSAAKAGLHAWTQASRYQLRDTPVRVFEVLPPLVDTEMIKELGATDAISPGEVADATLKAMAEDEEEIRIGPTKALYVVSRIAPQRVYRSLNRKIETMQRRNRKVRREAA
jgi:uncharacterized oxidoreductase